MTSSHRTEAAREAARLRDEEGLNGIQIAERLDVSRSYAYALLSDPDGSKDAARKRRYCGTCEVCGVPTYNGGCAVPPKHCARHSDGLRLGAPAMRAKTAPRRDAMIARWNAGVSASEIAREFGLASPRAVNQLMTSWRQRGKPVARRYRSAS